MFRFFLSFILLQISIFASSLSYETYKTDLISVDGRYGTIKDSEKIVIGSGGIVLHKFDEDKVSIIARVSVAEKKDGYAKLKFQVFDMLAQDAFPLPGILPKEGDEIILNFLYDRALIVAPNKEIYEEITKHFSQVQWIHPDLMAAYLTAEHRPNPDRKDFRKICYQNSAGLIFFALNNEGYFADCYSFKVLKTFKSGGIAKYMLPFYSRIEEVESVFWKIGNSQINDFDKHYKTLLVK